MKRISLVVVIFAIHTCSFAQIDLLNSKLIINADFRFRAEQDWHSKKTDGSFRDDRTRLRYRIRAGAEYINNWYSTGFRIRTGDPNKQQDAQLTLGDGYKEFGTLPIGLDRAYFQGQWDSFKFWVGKNTFPFYKSNELFWSDNVSPEGVFVEKGFKVKSNVINSVDLRGGYFIMSASGKSLDKDAYFQGFQANVTFLESRFEIHPSLYLFKNVPNIPDGGETFKMDYSILNLGTRIHLFNTPLLNMDFDYYNNFQNYNQINLIPSNLKGQKSGVVIGLKYGALKQKGDLLFEIDYANLQQYSAVDFMAQNDWARWDYSSVGSPDGRLTNFRGLGLIAGFKIDKKTSLIMKYFIVEQLVPYGAAKETGNRIRLDLDVKL